MESDGEKRMVRIEKSLFTLFILLLLSWAIYVALDWPLRASIIILVLGSAGVVLSLVQLISDLVSHGAGVDESAGIAFDAPALKPEGRWGNLEIWGWILGFYVTIYLIGFPVAIPLFVFAYVKVYGGRWGTALSLAFLAWAFLYGIFEKILHVPWPEPLLYSLMS